MTEHDQGLFSRGIYDFDDPSGCLMAVRIPPAGAADLYDGTRILVKPTQKALFIYNGQIADTLGPGNHLVHTDNLPVLTRLANWRFGMESPLRSEIWFFSSSDFLGRRWGTAQPTLVSFTDIGSVPIRGYGNYNVKIDNPTKFYLKIVGERTVVDISDLEDFIQGQILQAFPESLKLLKVAKDLNTLQSKVSEKLEDLVNAKLDPFGLVLEDTQVLSLTPPAEVVQALDEKVAMNLIGDPKEYLLYKMANRMDHLKEGSGGSDPAQLMMAMMLGKGLGGMDSRAKEEAPASTLLGKSCPACHQSSAVVSKFCAHCGLKFES